MGLPFTFIAVLLGSVYSDPTILDNKNWSVITDNMYNTSTVESMAIVGSANLFTAEICRINGNQPASVCGQSYITAIESKLG